MGSEPGHIQRHLEVEVLKDGGILMHQARVSQDFEGFELRNRRAKRPGRITSSRLSDERREMRIMRWNGRRLMTKALRTRCGSETGGVADSKGSWPTFLAVVLEEGALLEGEEDLHNWGTRRRRSRVRFVGARNASQVGLLGRFGVYDSSMEAFLGVEDDQRTADRRPRVPTRLQDAQP